MQPCLSCCRRQELSACNRRRSRILVPPAILHITAALLRDDTTPAEAELLLHSEALKAVVAAREHRARLRATSIFVALRDGFTIADAKACVAKDANSGSKELAGTAKDDNPTVRLPSEHKDDEVMPVALIKLPILPGDIIFGGPKSEPCFRAFVRLASVYCTACHVARLHAMRHG